MRSWDNHKIDHNFEGEVFRKFEIPSVVNKKHFLSQAAVACVGALLQKIDIKDWQEKGKKRFWENEHGKKNRKAVRPGSPKVSFEKIFSAHILQEYSRYSRNSLTLNRENLILVSESLTKTILYFGRSQLINYPKI